MKDKRQYYLIIGSKNYFESKLSKIKIESESDSFLDLVKYSDDSKQRGENFDYKAESLILRNNNYHGITEQAHDRIGTLIDELTTDYANIYIHNPPTILKSHIKNLELNNEIDIKYFKEEYVISDDKEAFIDNIKNISNNIIGQNDAIEEITKSMWYLSKCKRIKPYIIMLYGESSLGKTEIVKEIADKFFGEKYLEKHLSMFKNEVYSDYLFGEKPNRKTLGYDLLERESNLVFLDEFDKCPEFFYSAFYTLFDNENFKDASYEVDNSGLLIILTSNFKDENEMKKHLGLPIYYRVDKFIKFNNFSSNTIYNITMKEIRDRIEEYEDIYTAEEIYSKVSDIIQLEDENARTIKYKIQKTIEEMLFEKIRTKLDFYT